MKTPSGHELRRYLPRIRWLLFNLLTFHLLVGTRALADADRWIPGWDVAGSGQVEETWSPSPLDDWESEDRREDGGEEDESDLRPPASGASLLIHPWAELPHSIEPTLRGHGSAPERAPPPRT